MTVAMGFVSPRMATSGRKDAPAEVGMQNLLNYPGTNTRRLVAIVLAVVMVCVSAARGQDTVTLRPTAEVGEGKILLKDVADLEGKAAESLGDVVVLEKWTGGEASWTTLELSAVRTALNAASGVNWGRLSLNGSSCTVRRAVKPVEGPAPVPAAEPAALAPTPGGGSSVRDLVTARIAEIFSVDQMMLRLTFEASSKGLLDLSTTGRAVEITPSGVADRVPLTIRVFEKDRIVASGTTRVGVLIRRDVLIAKAAMKRGDVLDLSDVQIEARWVGPTLPVADIADMGSIVKASKITQGQMILDNELEPAVVIKKGEQVSVSCIAGTVIVRTMARAGSDGRIGDVISFEGTDKKKQVFLARVAGPGKAVAIAAGSEGFETAAEPAATSIPAGGSR
jgi:flagella basal body P-ring formation protein FlgA